MYEQIKDQYDEMLDVLRKKKVAGTSQVKPREIVAISWEKTVVDIYIEGMRDKAAFFASLAAKQENYGDTVAAFKNMKWCLLEFKADAPAINAEKKKFYGLSKNKYDHFEIPKDPLVLACEEQMFWGMKNFFDAAVIPSAAAPLREPHFFVYRPPASRPIRSLADLLAIRYWGAWAGVTKNNVEFSPLDIPDACADYDDFVRYAACFRLAKNGEFTADEDNEGGGHLGDLTAVLGINSDQTDGYVGTLGSFLQRQGLMPTLPRAAPTPSSLPVKRPGSQP